MGARELLHAMIEAGFTVESAADKLLIRPASKLNDDLRQRIRAAKPELLALLNRPYKLTPTDADAAHAEPWNDAACACFVARVVLFLRRGISTTDADDVAERLHLRDVHGDDRVLCVECRHLVGRTGAWRCSNHRAAGVGADLPRELTTTMQRCMGFDAAGTCESRHAAATEGARQRSRPTKGNDP